MYLSEGQAPGACVCVCFCLKPWVNDRDDSRTTLLLSDRDTIHTRRSTLQPLAVSCTVRETGHLITMDGYPSN